jgi:hypothetical protein
MTDYDFINFSRPTPARPIEGIGEIDTPRKIHDTKLRRVSVPRAMEGAREPLSIDLGPDLVCPIPPAPTGSSNT